MPEIGPIRNVGDTILISGLSYAEKLLAEYEKTLQKL